MVINSSWNADVLDGTRPVVLVGAGGPVLDLIELVRTESALELIGILDPDLSLKDRQIADVPVLGWLADLPASAAAAVIGLPAKAQGFDREAVFFLLVQKGLKFPSVVDVSACLDDVVLRRGCLVLPGATVATDALLGENCILGSNCRVEPGATVPDHTYILSDTVIDAESVAHHGPAPLALSAVLARSCEPLNDIIYRINWSHMEIILVVDEAGKLVGTITDGDIRRGILSGVSLAEPASIVMNPRPITVQESATRESMLQIMRQHSIRHLPMLDAEGRPVQLERMERLVDDYTGQAVVMAGGLGTRLQPFTNLIPKPLVSIAGRPILDHTLSRLRRSGIENVVISLNHMGDQIRRHIGTGRRRDLKIDYVTETRRLGTAGALVLLDPRPTKPFLVINGDLVTNLNYSRLLKFQQQEGYEMVLCVRQHAIKIPYGVVEVEGNCVCGLREKPNVESFINAGIYVLTPDCISLIPTDTYFDMTDLVEAVRQNGGRVGVFPIIEYWRDIGRPEDLEAANLEHEERFMDAADVGVSIPMETIS
jgi:NDP-sugar pyrophosphorylase family protein